MILSPRPRDATSRVPMRNTAGDRTGARSHEVLEHYRRLLTTSPLARVGPKRSERWDRRATPENGKRPASSTLTRPTTMRHSPRGGRTVARPHLRRRPAPRAGDGGDVRVVVADPRRHPAAAGVRPEQLDYVVFY